MQPSPLSEGKTPLGFLAEVCTSVQGSFWEVSVLAPTLAKLVRAQRRHVLWGRRSGMPQLSPWRCPLGLGAILVPAGRGAWNPPSATAGSHPSSPALGTCLVWHQAGVGVTGPTGDHMSAPASPCRGEKPPNLTPGTPGCGGSQA